MTPFQKTEAEGFLLSYFITSLFFLGQVFSTKPVRKPVYEVPSFRLGLSRLE